LASWYPFIGGERYCESKMFCPRTLYDDPGQEFNPIHSV